MTTMRMPLPTYEPVDPRSNYWIVGGQVFSSRRNIYVPVNDPDYTTWLSSHPAPHTLANEAELWGVINNMDQSYLPAWLFDGTSFVQPAVGQYAKAQLAAYSGMRRYEAEIQGTLSAGQAMRTDRVSRTAADQVLAYIKENPTVTVNWKTMTGFEAVDLARMVAMVTDINHHVQECFDIENNVFTAITAGTTTTLAQIDTAYQLMRSKAPPEIKTKIAV